MDNSYSGTFNSLLISNFKRILSISIGKPQLFIFLLKTVLFQIKAKHRRKKVSKKANIEIPPIIISSITNNCNLNCEGCYSKVIRKESNNELKTEDYQRIFSEAEELGVSVIFMAGGEPFMRKDIIDLTKQFPKTIFPTFTNGMLLTDEKINQLENQKNLIPIISIEGNHIATDMRRGEGVYKNFIELSEKLNKRNLIYGVSVTLTTNNFDHCTSESFVNELITSGCQLFYYIEYVPISKGTDKYVLTELQRELLIRNIPKLRKNFKGLFFAFPGDEEKFGGCLAAGRGFIHINPNGELEPCPFAPYSDNNLRNKPLLEALDSKFLQTIRENHYLLTETSGGCALWNHKDWVVKVLKDSADDSDSIQVA